MCIYRCKPPLWYENLDNLAIAFTQTTKPRPNLSIIACLGELAKTKITHNNNTLLE